MQEYFWSISIEEGLVQAAIWAIRDAEATVFHMSDPVTYEDNESLVAATDTCLSKCIQDLPQDIAEPDKATFGVPSFWVQDGQIEKTYLEKIKLVCEKLSLKPQGFVVMPEAIAHFEKLTEKAPINAILLGVYANNIDVTLFRLGSLAGSVKVGRSPSITDDVIEGLTRFGQTEAFPSRFLIYGLKEQDLEDIRQNLIQADWEVNENIKFLHTPNVEIFSLTNKMAAISLAGGAEMGSANGVSINNQSQEKIEHAHQPGVQESLSSAEDLGFVSGRDINIEEPRSSGADAFNALNFNRKLPKLNLKMPKNSVFLGAIAIFILFIVGIFAWVSLAKATVTVIVSPMKLEEAKQVKFGQDIQTKQFTGTATKDKSKTATGTVTIGHPAHGNVTFYNVSGSTTIDKGTTLSSGNLNFSLDGDVTIASASGAASASTAQGSITAMQVGADSNLAANSYFTIAGISSSLIQAKNDAALTDGSSQEVTAVSKDDVDTLTKDLSGDLTQEATNNLKSNLVPPYLLVDSSITTSVGNKTLDHEVGEQASTLKLSLTMKVTGSAVSRDDMNNLARQIFSNKVPNGYSINDDQIDFLFEKNDTKFIVNLLPDIDTKKIASQISGKNLGTAKTILSKISGFQDAKFVLKMGILPILPLNANNIILNISTN